jgi:hypothetical protein
MKKKKEVSSVMGRYCAHKFIGGLSRKVTVPPLLGIIIAYKQMAVKQ